MKTQPNLHPDPSLRLAHVLHILALACAMIGLALWVTGETGLAGPALAWSAAILALAASNYEHRHRAG